MRRDQIAKIGAAPAAVDKKIMSFGQRPQACVESAFEIADIVGAANDLPDHALDDGEKIFRSMRQLARQQLEMLLAALARCDVGAEREAWNRDADQECQQQEKKSLMSPRANGPPLYKVSHTAKPAKINATVAASR